jgi:hypothetical protein
MKWITRNGEKYLTDIPAIRPFGTPPSEKCKDYLANITEMPEKEVNLLIKILKNYWPDNIK